MAVGQNQVVKSHVGSCWFGQCWWKTSMACCWKNSCVVKSPMLLPRTATPWKISEISGKTIEVRDFPRYRRVTSTLKVAHFFQWKVMKSNRPTPWQLERLAPHRFAPCPPDPPNAPFASKKEGNPQQEWHFHGKKLWARLEKNIGKSWNIKNILRKLGRFQMLNVQLHRQIADFPMRNARCPSNLPNPNCFKGSKCEGLDYPVVCGSQTMHINCSFSDVRHLALSTQQSDPSWVCIAH